MHSARIGGDRTCSSSIPVHIPINYDYVYATDAQ